MAAAEQSSEPRRDYASPATWGDVESVRHEVADLRADVSRVESSLHADVSRVESSLRAEIARVENRLESKIDTGHAEVRMEMARMEMRLIRWTVATMLAGVAAIGVLIGILEAVR